MPFPGRTIALAAAFSLAAASNLFAVERSGGGEEEEAFSREVLQPKAGYASESRLKNEAGAKSFFFLSNDLPWPEKKPIPTATPATPYTPKKPAEASKPVAEVEAELMTPLPASKPETKPVGAVSKGKSPQKTAEGNDSKKSKAIKKRVMPLPDIEKLLADVRQSAKPKMSAGTAKSAAESPAKTQAITSEVAEVEGTVDIDDLARDLEKFQKDEEKPPGAPREKISTKPPEPPPAAASWWVISAGVTALAAAGACLFLFIRRRRPHIRPQSAIDAETRAYFKKLLAEQQRRRPAPAPQPALEPEPQEPVEYPPMAGDLMEPPPPVEEQNVFLLPPELAEGAYKEVVMMAGMGENAESISKKLNLGEGEVRLVLDIARLSRYHPAPSS